MPSTPIATGFRSTLTAYLGRHWLLVIAVFLFVFFGPVFLFWNRIRFSPDDFVEEWIKALGTGVILYVIIEHARHRSATYFTLNSVRELMDLFWFHNVDNAIAAHERLDGAAKAGDIENLRVAARSLDVFLDHLTQGHDAISEIARGELALATLVAEAWKTLDQARCKNYVAAFLRIGVIEELRPDEVTHIGERLRAFRLSMSNIHSRL